MTLIEHKKIVVGNSKALAGGVCQKAITSERVIRDGSWENYDNLIRVSNRNREQPTQSYYLGFRYVAQPSR